MRNEMNHSNDQSPRRIIARTAMLAARRAGLQIDVDASRCLAMSTNSATRHTALGFRFVVGRAEADLRFQDDGQIIQDSGIP